MMLEAGSNPRVKNKGGLTPFNLVDPANPDLRQLIRKHEYAALNAGDFVNAEPPRNPAPGAPAAAASQQAQESDDDAEFSGSDDEERAEWERRRKAKRG